MSKRLLLRGGVGLAAIMAWTTPVLAQPAPAPAPDEAQPPAPPSPMAPPAADTSSTLGEIVVTAQRRGENLQQVPISVTAITADAARAEGIVGTADLQTTIPSLIMTPNVGVPVIFLRGVGTDQVSGGDESSVATYVDGVYMASLSSTLFNFNNIERIEVLEGPQGTLFGRNATGGVINVITRDPSFARRLDASIQYGNFDTVEGQLYASGGIGDKVALNLAVYVNNQGKGWGTNVYDGSQVYKGNSLSIRTKQLIRLGADSSLVIAEDYSKNDGSLSGDRAPLPGAFAVGHTGYLGNIYNVDYNSPNYQNYEGGGISGHFEAPLLGARLVNILAFRQSAFDSYLDVDSTPFPSNGAYQHYDNHYWTEELQLQSEKSSPFKWIGGFYYYKAFDVLDPLNYFGQTSGGVASPQASFGGMQTIVSHLVTTSYAGFGQVTTPSVLRTNLTLGIRYTNDNRSFDSYSVAPAKPAPYNVVDTQKTWPAVTYRVALDHHFTDDIMMYVSNSTGFKSGQFNLTNALNAPVAPERLNATELGFKSESWGHRLRLNMAGFYYDYKDLQLNERTSTGQTFVLNAANATIYGLDASLVVRPIPPLDLHADLSLLHGRYNSFANAPIYLPTPATCLPTPHSTGAPTGGNTTCTINASGNTLERSPPVSFNVGGSYMWKLPGDATLTATALYYYTSGSYFQPDNRLKQAPYGLVNANLAYAGSNFSVRVWTKNLLNKQYYAFLAESGGDFGAPGAPRTFGVTLGLSLR